MVNGLSMLNENMESVPYRAYDTHTEVILVVSKGRRERMVRSSISTSITNINPAIGALKMPATAPAAPHPTSNISVCGGKWNRLPRSEPMAEPVSTIGASAPTDPPNPMVMELANTLDQRLWGRIRARLREMAYNILVTP